MTTAHTIAVMDQLARHDCRSPSVRAFAEEVRGLAELISARSGEVLTALHVAEAVERLVESRVRYTPDPYEYELIRSPDYMLTTDPRGDCDDQATLIASALLALDMHPQFERIGYGVEDADDPYSHVVVVLDGPEHGYPSDIVIDSTTHVSAQRAMLASAATLARHRLTRR